MISRSFSQNPRHYYPPQKFFWHTGFILEKQNLEEIEKKIIRLLTGSQIEYTVYRLDGSYSHIYLIQDLIKEENKKDRKIKALEIKANNNNTWITLSFGTPRESIKYRTSRVKLQVEGGNKSTTESLFHDIKRYLKKEVICRFNFWNQEYLGIVLLLIYGTLFYLIDITLHNPSNLSILEFIYLQNIPLWICFTLLNFIFIFACFPIVINDDPSSSIYRLKNFFFPNRFFLWGGDLEEYKNSEKRRSNLFWCGIIALIIGTISGLIGSFIFMLITRN